jgi:hypothetical protein
VSYVLSAMIAVKARWHINMFGHEWNETGAEGLDPETTNCAELMSEFGLSVCIYAQDWEAGLCCRSPQADR